MHGPLELGPSYPSAHGPAAPNSLTLQVRSRNSCSVADAQHSDTYLSLSQYCLKQQEINSTDTRRREPREPPTTPHESTTKMSSPRAGLGLRFAWLGLTRGAVAPTTISSHVGGHRCAVCVCCMHRVGRWCPPSTSRCEPAGRHARFRQSPLQCALFWRQGRPHTNSLASPQDNLCFRNNWGRPSSTLGWSDRAHSLVP